MDNKIHEQLVSASIHQPPVLQVDGLVPALIQGGHNGVKQSILLKERAVTCATANWHVALLSAFGESNEW